MMLKKRGGSTTVPKDGALKLSDRSIVIDTKNGWVEQEAFNKLREDADEVQRTLELALSAVRYDGNGTPSVDRAVWELVLMQAARLGVEATAPVPDSGLGGSRFDVRGGLRPSEVILLRRAVGYYCKAYQEMMVASSVPWEKNESRQYIIAADNLDDRLLRDLVPHIERTTDKERP